MPEKIRGMYGYPVNVYNIEDVLMHKCENPHCHNNVPDQNRYCEGCRPAFPLSNDIPRKSIASWQGRTVKVITGYDQASGSDATVTALYDPETDEFLIIKVKA